MVNLPVFKANEVKGRLSVLQTTPPVAADFGWINQGLCGNAVNPSGAITIFHPGAVGLGFNWGIFGKPIPAPPYKITAGFGGHLFDKAAAMGVALYDEVSGKLVVYCIDISDTGVLSLAGYKMNSFTSFAGSYFRFQYGALGGMVPKFFMLRDDGSQRRFYVSQDAEVWAPVLTAPSADFLVATHWGYALRALGNSISSFMTITHEEIVA